MTEELDEMIFYIKKRINKFNKIQIDGCGEGDRVLNIYFNASNIEVAKLFKDYYEGKITELNTMQINDLITFITNVSNTIQIKSIY